MKGDRGPLWFWIIRERWPWRGAILGLSIVGVVLGLVAPIPQKILIDRLLGIQSASELLNLPLFALLQSAHVPGLILTTAVAFLGSQLLGLAAGWLGTRESVKLQQRLAQDLYTKALLQRSDHVRGVSVGEQVAVFATDVPGAGALLDQTLPLGAGVVLPLMLAPVLIAAISPIPTWLAFTVVFTVLLIDLILARRQARFFARFKGLAAERVALVNEWVQNIRLLRILGWVTLFERRIRRVREIETDNRVRMVTNGQFMGSIGNSVSFVLNIAGVLFLVKTSAEPISPGTLFAILWIFGILLAKPFRQVPWVLTMTFDALTSLRRLEVALGRPQLAAQNEEPAEVSTPKMKSFNSVHSLPENDPEIEVVNLKLSSLQGRVILDGINLSVKKGEWIALVGDVGSGKSQLLLSLLGETPCTHDLFRFRGKTIATESDLTWLKSQVGFVGQDGFVLSGSLRQNLSLVYRESSDTDHDKVESLRQSQFDIEAEGLRDGLDTMIGERGVNLSGGQRQRVALARAAFFNREVIFLDDALSAVDVTTEGQLIQELFQGRWRGLTRLLVTHRLSVLKNVDRIVFLRDGRIAANGSFADLMGNREFREFVELTGDQENRPREPKGTV